VKPDIVPIAKGIGGGFPIGAVLMNKKVASSMTAGTHGSTFGAIHWQ
jgi:acetylornithine/N-succinyldiaminopimelate aminotransferase